MTSQVVTICPGCRGERVDGGRRRQLGRQPGVQLRDLQQVRVNQVGKKLEMEKYEKSRQCGSNFNTFLHQKEVLMEPRPTNSGEKRLLQVFDSLEEHELL